MLIFVSMAILALLAGGLIFWLGHLHGASTTKTLALHLHVLREDILNALSKLKAKL